MFIYIDGWLSLVEKIGQILFFRLLEDRTGPPLWPIAGLPIRLARESHLHHMQG